MNRGIPTVSNRSSFSSDESNSSRCKPNPNFLKQNISEPQSQSEVCQKNTSNQRSQYSSPENASIGRFSIFSQFLQTESDQPSPAQPKKSSFANSSYPSSNQSLVFSPSKQSCKHAQQAAGNSSAFSFICKIFRLSTVDRHVPNIILFSGLLLLTLLASSYLLLKDRHINSGKFADLKHLICLHDRTENIDSHNCVLESDLPTVLNVLQVLFDILSRYSGEHLCGQSAASPRMETNTARHLVSNHFNTKITEKASKVFRITPRVWRSSLLLIHHLGPKNFGIIAYSFNGDSVDDIGSISELEGLIPYLPGICRLQRFLSLLSHLLVMLVWILLLILSIVGIVYGAFRFVMFRKRCNERRSAAIREVVQHVISLLQQQSKKHTRNPIEPPFVPVLRIKETLANSFSVLNSIWPSVEDYVHRYEGDILVQEWRGLGETWQWHGRTVPQNSPFCQLDHPLNSRCLSGQFAADPASTSSSPKQPNVSQSANPISPSCNDWFWRWGYSLNYSPQ